MYDNSLSRNGEGVEPVTLMLIGGGIRFPAFVGALRAIEETGIPIKRIIGASTGSIIAALYAAGISPREMQEKIFALDTTTFKDPDLRNFMSGKGFCRGDSLEAWVDEQLEGKRFSDSFHIPLSVIATDILHHSPHILSTENTPNLSVARAVRFSAGIPVVFACKPFTIRGKKHIFIDGSLMASVIETQSMEAGKTLIIKTFSKRSLNQPATSRLTLKRYAGDLLNVLCHSMDREFLKGGKWKSTINIHCGTVSPFTFSLSHPEKEFLIEQGLQQTRKYLRYKWGV